MNGSEFQLKGFNKKLNNFRYKKIKKLLFGRSCLEIGAGYGHLSKELSKRFKDLVVVEPDPECYNNIPPTIERYCIHFEDFIYGQQFDTIICTNVLEHVDNVPDFLKKIKQFTKEKTRIIIVVPNAISYNRLLGVELGMINSPTELTEQDKKAGHKRMFYPKLLREELEYAGFQVESLETYLYKPIHNSMMNRLDSKVTAWCFNLEMKENGAEILAVCKL